jgi:hypothetical protein
MADVANDTDIQSVLQTSEVVERCRTRALGGRSGSPR